MVCESIKDLQRITFVVPKLVGLLIQNPHVKKRVLFNYI